MFGWEGELPQPAARTVEDMRPVLRDARCRYSKPLYFMYRDLAGSDMDRQWLREHRLRYDLTVIPPCDLGGERVKTKGHYHPKNPACVGYPEVYEVLEGRAHYLLQSRELDDIVLLGAGAGDIVVIPPGYGHITINPDRYRTLAMANIVSTEFESEYAEYEARHGAAYYALSDGTLEKNPSYGDVPPVRKPGPDWWQKTRRICRTSLYSLVGNERALAFLNTPEDYLPVFGALLRG